MQANVFEQSSRFVGDLAVDGDGMAHVVYVTEEPAFTVYYAHRNDVEVVGRAGDALRSSIGVSLAIREDGGVGVAYTDDRSADLIYAERTPSGWITETVDAHGETGYFPSLTYDSSGQPHISYFDLSENDLEYAQRTADGWRLETVDVRGKPGFHLPAGFTRLALHEDTPHIAYLGYRYKPEDGELRYATQQPWGWDHETVDRQTGAGGFPSLQLDADGLPWISYYRVGTWDYETGELRVAWFDGQRWRVEIVDGVGDAGRFNELALTAAEEPIVVYYVGNSAELRLAQRQNNRWHTTPYTANAGAWCNIAIAPNNDIHLTYVDHALGKTRHDVFRAR